MSLSSSPHSSPQQQSQPSSSVSSLSSSSHFFHQIRSQPATSLHPTYSQSSSSLHSSTISTPSQSNRSQSQQHTTSQPSTSSFISSSSYSSSTPATSQSNRRSLPTTMPRTIHTIHSADTPTFELRQSKKDSHRKYSFKYCFAKCQNNNKTPGISFSKIPKKPECKANMKKPRNVRTFHKKLNHHNLVMKRCGMKEGTWKQNARFCSFHSTESVILKKKIDICGVVEEIVFEYKNVPTGKVLKLRKVA